VRNRPWADIDVPKVGLTCSWLPQWQDLAIGDYMKYRTQNGPGDAWELAALEPDRFLGGAG
jgi:hypothetical protein